MLGLNFFEDKQSLLSKIYFEENINLSAFLLQSLFLLNVFELYLPIFFRSCVNGKTKQEESKALLIENLETKPSENSNYGIFGNYYSLDFKAEIRLLGFFRERYNIGRYENMVEF